jgi:SAM-dependent methyltransferase
MSHRIPFDDQQKLEDPQFSYPEASAAPLQQVCEFLHYLVKRGGFHRIVDIGCGSVKELKNLDVEVTCVGPGRMRELVARSMPRAEFVEWDLDRELPELGFSLRGAVVVCADVIEHLQQPERLIRDLARIARECAYVLISAPDRLRAPGLMNEDRLRMPAHTKGWTAVEFAQFLLNLGFPKDFLLGYTLNNSVGFSKNTILVIAGREATFTRSDRQKSVAAIINVFNENDILEQVVRYLRDQGVQVHIVDNWSTDGSYEIAKKLLTQDVCANVIRFPAAPSANCEWKGLLRHTAEYGARLQSDWIIHYDADEFRCAPWPSVTLAEGISFVDDLGYTAVDFTVLNFGFTDDDEQVPFSAGARRFFDFGRHPSYHLQIKAWKNQGQVIDLGSSGGHIAAFAGSRVFPLKFLTKHYPLRSTKQASTKIFRDRLPRFARENRELGWHTHYDTFRQVCNIRPWRRHELLFFDPTEFGMEFLIERLSGIGIETEERAIPNINTIFEWMKVVKSTEAHLRGQAEDAKREIAAMRRSTSWRITAPIRGLKTNLMRAFSVSRRTP